LETPGEGEGFAEDGEDEEEEEEGNRYRGRSERRIRGGYDALKEGSGSLNYGERYSSKGRYEPYGGQQKRDGEEGKGGEGAGGGKMEKSQSESGVCKHGCKHVCVNAL
jgi:hypothetical protein